MIPYLEHTLKELNKALRGLSRADRINALEIYLYGLALSLHSNYPNKVAVPETIAIDEKYVPFFESGKHEGDRFGPLEVECARDFLYSFIENKKRKLSRRGLFGLFKKK